MNDYTHYCLVTALYQYITVFIFLVHLFISIYFNRDQEEIVVFLVQKETQVAKDRQELLDFLAHLDLR